MCYISMEEKDGLKDAGACEVCDVARMLTFPLDMKIGLARTRRRAPSRVSALSSPHLMVLLALSGHAGGDGEDEEADPRS
jgi:hypothetical protein